jgi:hypothetical protein
MNPETLRQAAVSKHKMSVQEAQKILEVHTGATLGEIKQVSAPSPRSSHFCSLSAVCSW